MNCDCNGGYFCPSPPSFNASVYYANTPGSRQDECVNRSNQSLFKSRSCFVCSIQLIVQELLLLTLLHQLIYFFCSLFVSFFLYRCEYNCTACLAGSIADGNDFSSTCAACGLGTQQPLEGSETCELCAAGTFANETGSALCSPCGLVLDE